MLLGAALLIVAGLKMFVHLHEYKDVLCWDEAAYMRGGVSITQKIPKGWGPLYSFWYFLLLIGQKVFASIDLLKLNYLNFKILAITGPVLLYLFMLLKRVHPIAAFVISAGYLMSAVNTSTWPHISHFTFMVLLIGLIISHFFKSRLMQWMIILVTVFLTSYARPELFLAFAMLLLAFVVYLVLNKFKFSKVEYAFAFFGFGFIFLVQYKMGIAMLADTSGGTGSFPRDVFAFGQHFAINYFQWYNIEEELWRDWVPYFEKYFENKGSLLSSGLTNPPMLIKHITTNIGRLTHNTLQYIADSVLLGRIFNFPLWLKLGLIAGFLAMAIYIGRSFKTFLHFLWTSEQGFLLMVLLFFAAPTYVACVLIYARDHYILLQMPFYLCAIGFIFFLKNKESEGQQLNSIAILLIGLFVIVFIPNKEQITYFDLWQNRSQPHNYYAVQKLKTLDYSRYSKEHPINMLENEGGLSIFTMKPEIMPGIPPFNTDSISFPELLEKKQYELLFITPSMVKDPILKTYENWDDFVSNPEKYNFRNVPIEGIESYFLIKKGALE
jgi:hypothetical protein